MEAEFRKNAQLLALKMEMCQEPRNPEKVKTNKQTTNKKNKTIHSTLDLQKESY